RGRDRAADGASRPSGRMTPPFVLIAEREFRTYVATISFWVALLVGPVIALLAGLAIAQLDRASAPIPVGVVSSSPALAETGARALAEVAALQGLDLRVRPAVEGDGAAIRMEAGAGGEVRVSTEGRPLLAEPYWTLFLRTVERDFAREMAGFAPSAAAPVPADGPVKPDVGAAVGRFAVVLMLWMTLTGSLGMLLQAVVRERANRALESLMAAASPWTIVTGKLVGVGGVSLVVLVAWLGSGALLSRVLNIAGATPGMFPAGDVDGLPRTIALYVLAFALYGFCTIAVGVRARDTAVAQNLVRPVFGVLLLAFFCALTVMMGVGGGMDWLAWVPPFTPFVLLMQPPGSLSLATQAAMVMPAVIATALAALAAVKGLTLNLHERRRSPRDRRGRAQASRTTSPAS
ncbi:MAG TPA: ABC transporter permease, partial [Brevundimonas sp.]|nr:ABC transporter permease [Brevundimonas sp.]